jgi:PmbA protein
MKKEELARKLVDAALKAGADEAEVSLREDRELNVEVRMGELDVLKESGSRKLALRVYRNQSKAQVSSSDFSPEAMEALARDAVDLASVSQADEYHRLPEAELYAREIPELDLHDSSEALSASSCIDMAKQAEEVALDSDARIENSQGSSGSRGESSVYRLTSNGFAAGFSSTIHSLYCIPVARDSAGDLVRGFWGRSSVYHEDLPDPEEVGKKAAEETLLLCDARKAPTGEVPVIFDARVSSAILHMLFRCISGASLWRKLSYLDGRLHTPVASELVHLVDDPHRLRGLGSRPFDDEGIASKPIRLIENGILKHFVTNVESSRRLGLPCTGHGGWESPSNLYLEAGDLSREDIIEDTKTGLLVTGLMGSNFDSTSGHWSQGVEGLWIEKGKIAYPVKGATIAGNLDDLLQSIDAVGKDLDFSRGSVVSPSIRFPSMMVSGE